MPEQVTITVYRFNELSDEAKEKAIENHRYDAVDGWFWWDCTTYSIEEVGKILGFDGLKPVTFDLDRRYWYLAFEGDYNYRKGSTKSIREMLPKDEEIHRIADALQEMQRRHFYTVSATLKPQRGGFRNEWTGVDAWCDAHDGKCNAEEWLREIVRDLEHWALNMLQSDYEYQTSDEYIAEMLEANDYRFLEDGSNA